MFDILYNNIGGKIKGLAKFIFIFNSVIALMVGLKLSVDNDERIVLGLLILIGVPIVSWILSWFLYAFGELVEDVGIIRRQQNTSEKPPMLLYSIHNKNHN